MAASANRLCKLIATLIEGLGRYWFLKDALHLCYRHHGGITKDARTRQ